jgi:hypothetical protein
VIQEVVDEAGVRERRRRLLPAAGVMVFVLGCCLFSGDAYGEVARKLAGWLGPLAGRPAWRVPGSAALARARRRLGARPFELLFARLAGPLAGPGTPGAMAFGRVLVALDGTSVEVPHTPANLAAFGPPPSGRAAGAGFPQVQLATVTGCGTRALVGAAFGPRRGAGCSEQDLARQLTGVLRPGMLVLADRGFCGYPVVSALAATGAQVIIRVRADQRLPVMRAVMDGSYQSVLPEPRASHARLERNRKRRLRGTAPDTGPLPGRTVRVITFTLTVTAADGRRRSEPYRLITTLLDPAEAPAAQVAACYAQRWEAETGYRELKVSLRGPGRVLRSKDPAMVRQEIWAMLCACQLIQAQRAAAAAAATPALDPDRISFTVTLHAVRRQITSGRRRPQRALISEILGQLLPPRRPRSYPRLPLNPAASRRNARAGHNGAITYTITINPASTGLPGP